MKKDEVTVEISGKLDERAVLPPHNPAKIIRLNFKNLTGINSLGLRNFVTWLEAHKDAEAILAENCPTLFINNVNVMGILHETNFKIRSFYVPFYSEKTDEFKDHLFKFEEDFFQDGSYVIPKILDSNGEPMMVDVHPRSFFRFLKTKV